jgi:hypothetical protein
LSGGVVLCIIRDALNGFLGIKIEAWELFLHAKRHEIDSLISDLVCISINACLGVAAEYCLGHFVQRLEVCGSNL